MNADRLAMAFRLLGIGWYVAICIGGGTYGGLLLDRQLGWSPLLTLIGLAIGIAAAIGGMLRMLMGALSAGQSAGADKNGDESAAAGDNQGIDNRA